jgi:hypothetical protein
VTSFLSTFEAILRIRPLIYLLVAACLDESTYQLAPLWHSRVCASGDWRSSRVLVPPDKPGNCALSEI